MRCLPLILLSFLFLHTLLAFPAKVFSKTYKVLVVMSYDDKYAWVKEIREGIEGVLSNKADIKYVYLNTKNDFEGGTAKAKEALEIFHTFKPDGVIAADDNAQSFFVVPHLKNKVKTPVVFCGVNNELSAYGYPASNVTGILERLHIGKSLAFAQQLIPSIKKVGFIQKDSTSGHAVLKQIEAERQNYPIESANYIMPKNLKEAKDAVLGFKNEVDAIFYETLEGLPDEKGQLYSDRELIPMLSKLFGKPLISNNLYHVKYGTLCAVIKTGQEQGRVAAEKLLAAMQGKPIKEILVSTNSEGRQVLNVTIMESMNIKPKPIVLKGVQLVKTAERYKVLVVQSYENDFLWSQEVKAGIESTLGEASEIDYFYMNTKTNFKDGPLKAKQAYQLFREFNPDGVISVDDNAQSLFIVPYLKDKVVVPVVFCGVNAEPSKYGYPASNVTGVLERGHIKESIAFLQELVPTSKTISYMARESPTGRAVLRQAKNDARDYSIISQHYLLPSTLEEALEMAAELKQNSDVMFLATLQGIKDKDGKSYSEKIVIPLIASTFGKPIISDNAYNMKYGMLCALAVSGKEQGVKAGKKLLKALKGTPISELPITKNDQGRRMLNVSVMKELGIKPAPSSLIGVELIKTE